MKKMFSVSIISAVAASMLSLNSFAAPICNNIFSSDNINGCIIVGGAVLGGNISCGTVPDLKPEIIFPGQGNDAPSGDSGTTNPGEDSDTPSGDNGATNPDNGNDAPSGDNGITNPGEDSDTPSGDSGTTAPEEDTDTSMGESNLNAYEKEVVRLINEIRVQNGIGQLNIDTELSRVARIKSQDMKNNNYFSHTSPVYGSPFDMMKQFGISYRTAAENIAKGQSTPQSVVNAWMNSDGHRANILNSSFTRIGMGYVADGHYWTQMFAG